jgi:DNA-3-methyladenine glycosylase I
MVETTEPAAAGTPAAATVVTGVVVGSDGLARCAWGAGDPLYRAYHDDDWGRPLHDEHALFELLTLEAFQSGLSWLTILRKRPNFVTAFEGFDPERIAAYGPEDEARLLADAGIVRNRAKVDATIANARAVVALHEAGTSLSEVLWAHAPEPGGPDRPPAGGRFTSFTQLPASTAASTGLSKDLRRRGFRFVGPVVAYALMQSAGLVDDHLDGCHVAVPPGPGPGHQS